MNTLLILTLSSILSAMPIERVTRDSSSPLVGTYLGTSAFIAGTTDEAGYNDTIPIWLVFEDSAYYYGQGESLPEPEPLGDGGGPYEWTDSTVTLNGAYPKILWPAAVLRGTYTWELNGDSLVMAKRSDITASGGSTSGLHRLELIRQ